MRKFSLFVTTVVLSLMAFASQPLSASAAQKVDPLGLVVAYIPGQSIVIVDVDGNQFTFELAADLKTVPADRWDLLVVGAYVTIFAPDNSVATAILIHAQPPASSPIPKEPTKEPAKETPSPVESPTEKATVTAKPTGVETSIETPTPKATLPGESLTPTEIQPVKPSPKDSTPSVGVSFIDWLASLLRQILSAGN